VKNTQNWVFLFCRVITQIKRIIGKFARNKYKP
jgi:hypothetical protein